MLIFTQAAKTDINMNINMNININLNIKAKAKLRLRLIALTFILAAFACVLCSCGASSAKTKLISISLDEKSISRGSPTISITAALSDTYANQNKGSVYLLEILPGNTGARRGSLSDAVLCSQSKIRRGELKFSLPLYESSHSRLMSSFVLAQMNEDGKYEAITDIKYISNPEALAQNRAEYPSVSSIKGLAANSDMLCDFVDTGVSHTVIPISVNDFLLPDGVTSAVSHTFNGTTRFFSEDAVARLDTQVKAYSALGINIFARFILDKAPNAADPSVLCLYYGADEASSDSVRGYALNISSESAAERLSSLFDFIAERYSCGGDAGFISSFIIGNSLNDAGGASYNYGAQQEEYIRKTCEIVRLANTALLSHYSNGRVYISLDDNWEGTAELNPGSITARKFLMTFKALAETETDFRWHTALAAQLEVSDAESFENGTLFESNGKFLLLSDISDAVKLLTDTTFKYNAAEQRSIIIDSSRITCDGSDAEKLQRQGAAYAYCYISALSADALDAFIYSELYDNSSPQSGLPGNLFGGLKNSDGKKPVYDVFKYIGGADALAAGGRLGWVLDTLGIEFKALYDNAEESGALAGHGMVSGTPLSVSYSENNYTLTVLCDYENGAYFDSLPLHDGVPARLSRTENGAGVSLCTEFDSNIPLGARGIIIENIDPTSLRGREAVALVLEAQAAYTDGLAIGLNILQGDTAYSASAYIKNDTYGTVCFDIGAFTSLMSKEKITFTVFLLPAAETERTAVEAALKIDEIYAVDITAKKGSGNPALVITVVIIIMVLIVLIIEIIKQIAQPSHNGKQKRKKL